MARARIDLALGHVLRAQPFRDSSLLVEAWTQDHGRVGLVARSTRSPRSRTRALLQPFQPLLLSWVESGDLATLTAVEAAAPPLGLGGETVFSGWYLNELLLRLLTRHDPHPGLYRAYAIALAGLEDDLEPTLRRFELQLLDELGYGLPLDEDFVADACYRFEPEQGFVPVAEGRRPGAVSGRSLLALREGRLDSDSERQDARRLLRSALRPLLGDRELESARLLRQLRSSGGGDR